MFPFVLLAALGGLVWWNATKKRSSAASPDAAPPFQPQWPTGEGVPAPPGSDMSKQLVTDWAIEVCKSGSSAPCVDSVAIDDAIQAANAGFVVKVGFGVSRVGPSGGTERFNATGRLVGATMSPDKRRVSGVQLDADLPGGAPAGTLVYLFDNNIAAVSKAGGPQPTTEVKSDPIGELKDILAGVSGNVANLRAAHVGQYDYESNTSYEYRAPRGGQQRAQQYGGDPLALRRPRFWR